MQPTDQQLNHFHTFGFLIFPALLQSRTRLNGLPRNSSKSIQTHGTDHDGTKHTQIVTNARSQREALYTA